ncbi:MAG: tetratricopeptide repeat protein [Chitinophagaceae bacterium]|nr:tetratricopeptide repeat protein [Chitinophagaceae bacterium]
MKYVLAFFYLQLLFTTAHGQNTQVTDSLLQQVKKETDPKKKFDMLIALGGKYVFTNADSAVFFNTKALEIARQLKIDSLLASSHYAIASIEATRNNYDVAFLNCDSSFKYFSAAGNRQGLGMVRNVQGGMYMASGRNELASQMYFDAIEYTKSDTASTRILYTYHNIVILLNNMDKHDRALEYAFRQYEWAKRLNIPDEIAYACSNIADTYMELKDSANAATYINRFTEASKNTVDPYLQVIGKNQLGMLKYIEKNYEISAQYFLQSLKLNNNLVDQQLGCITLLSLGRVYQKMNNYSKADSCFLKAINISRELNIKEERKSAFEMLAANAIAQKDYQKAYAYMESLQSIRDTLLNEKTEMALADAETKYKLGEKQKELELANAERKIQAADATRQKTVKLIILFSGAGILLIAALLFNRYKLKKELEKHDLLLEERTRIGKELHDDLGGGLSTIRLMTEMIKDPLFGMNGTYLDNISFKSRELIQNMNEIVWSLNNSNDNIAGMIAYMRQYAGTFLEDASIHLSFHEPQTIPAAEVDGHTRRHIFLVVKEALHNIVKHSGANEVKIHISIDDHFTVSIADNGKGISDVQKGGSGNGLRNMKQRIAALQGRFQIIQQEGTTLIFSIPRTSLYNKSVS